MLIDLTPEELKFIKKGIWTAQFECVLPERHENEAIDALMKKLRMDEWLLVHGENYFSLVEQYQCSECGEIVSGSPPERCPDCKILLKYRGNSTTCRLEGEE